MKQISTNSYNVFFGEIETIFSEWLLQQHYSKVVIITDKRVHKFCLAPLLANPLFSDIPVIEIAAGEAQKNLKTCEKIWKKMLAEGLDRKSLVINLGGGVIGDMGGFCAALYKRGVDFVLIPTTLLAMTDASIGGKLGIDFQGIKNTIGVFQEPKAVFIDVRFLKTLPENELRSGFAEVLKHAKIAAPEILEELKSAENLRLLDWKNLLPISVSVKVEVVKRDPFEKDLRRILNFGHTIGHAIEAYFLKTKRPITHGEAVFVGMICETFLAQGEPASKKIFTHFSPHFPKIDIPLETAFEEIWQFMLQDKKNEQNKVVSAVPIGDNFEMTINQISNQGAFDSLSFYNNLPYFRPKF